MANRKVKSENRRVASTYTIQFKLKNKIEEISNKFDISMSQFVEEAIIEKIQKIEQNEFNN